MIRTAVASVWPLERGRLVSSVIVMLLPSVVSARLIASGQLEVLKNSASGPYVRRTRPFATGLRAGGMIAMGGGSLEASMDMGRRRCCLIAYAWTRGLLASPRERAIVKAEKHG